jgi:hypothetical protein
MLGERKRMGLGAPEKKLNEFVGSTKKMGIEAQEKN